MSKKTKCVAHKNGDVDGKCTWLVFTLPDTEAKTVKMVCTVLCGGVHTTAN